MPLEIDLSNAFSRSLLFSPSSFCLSFSLCVPHGLLEIRQYRLRQHYFNSRLKNETVRALNVASLLEPERNKCGALAYA